MKRSRNIFEAKMRPGLLIRLIKGFVIVRSIDISITNTLIYYSLGVIRGKRPQSDPQRLKKAPHHEMV